MIESPEKYPTFIGYIAIRCGEFVKILALLHVKNIRNHFQNKLKPQINLYKDELL